MNAALLLAWPKSWVPNRPKLLSHYRIAPVRLQTTYYGDRDPQTCLHGSRYEVGTQSDVPTLLLYENAALGTSPLPYPLSQDDALAFVQGWLKQVPKQPVQGVAEDAHGWHVFVTNWGKDSGHFPVIGIQHAWAIPDYLGTARVEIPGLM